MVPPCRVYTYRPYWPYFSQCVSNAGPRHGRVRHYDRNYLPPPSQVSNTSTTRHSSSCYDGCVHGYIYRSTPPHIHTSTQTTQTAQADQSRRESYSHYTPQPQPIIPITYTPQPQKPPTPPNPTPRHHATNAPDNSRTAIQHDPSSCNCSPMLKHNPPSKPQRKPRRSRGQEEEK